MGRFIASNGFMPVTGAQSGTTSPGSWGGSEEDGAEGWDGEGGVEHGR